MESTRGEAAASVSADVSEPTSLSERLKPLPMDGPAYQIYQEHCYSKLCPFRGTPAAGFFPTEYLFPALMKDDASDGRSDGERERGEGDRVVESGNRMGEGGEEEVKVEEEGEEEEEGDIDVVGVEPPRYLPYEESKAGLIMMECVKHLNLVKIPPENSDLLLEKVLLECGFQQRRLLSTLLRILQGDHLARLTCQQAVHEPIKRRLHNDRAVQQFRKALSDVNWDQKLVTWAHETLIQLLDRDLLPVYLDVLQILKSKCPVLVEQVVHSSLSLVGGEAFNLLLKRPWNPVVGMSSVDRQVHFENPPVFVTLPYSSVGLGGRRWRLWQSQLSSIGKVYPVIMPDVLSEPGRATCKSLPEFSEAMLTLSLARVREIAIAVWLEQLIGFRSIPDLVLYHQFPTRPIVLLAWTMAGRIAAKIAEVVPIGCIVSLGLPARGLHHEWEVASDLFTQCNVPTIFLVGSSGTYSSVSYVESLRAVQPAPTSLVVVGGGDDLLRLSSCDKYSEEVCQSIADRCVLEKVYRFMVYNLPSSFPDEASRPNRKRKASHNEDIGASFLTPAMSHSSIVLNPQSTEESNWNCNLNNSNAFLKSFLSMRQNSRSGFASHSPSPIPFDSRGSVERQPPTKMQLVGELPKIGRPRSRSAADRPRKRVGVQSRSKSIDNSEPGSDTLTCIPLDTSNTNSNNNNSADSSPTQLLRIPYASFRPLPITPPRNPYADDSSKTLHPKTLKQLQRK